MNQQHPQPGRDNSGQPGWPPQPPRKKRSVGRTIGIGCGGVFALLIAIGAIGALLSGGGDKESTDAKATPTTARVDRPAAGTESNTPTPAPTKSEKKTKTVVLKVWGTAPAGALGPIDITYGSDRDSRQGTFRNGEFSATLPLDNDALYYTVTAQLQGSGDITCSVTVDGHTEKAHASGGYTICHAQANKGFFGGWG